MLELLIFSILHLKQVVNQLLTPVPYREGRAPLRLTLCIG